MDEDWASNWSCIDHTPEATSVVGVSAGINIFRVHDVWQNKQAIDVAYEIKKLNR